MLEALYMRSVAGDPATPCLDAYLDCVEKVLGQPSTHIHKARVHAFLATRRRPAIRLREAARVGYWPWDHDAFKPLRNFLSAL